MCQQVAMAVLEVLCSLTGWFALYQLFCSACAQRRSEWNCRLVTLSHGVLIVLLTGYVAFVDGPWPFTHAGQKPLRVAVTFFKFVSQKRSKIFLPTSTHHASVTQGPRTRICRSSPWRSVWVTSSSTWAGVFIIVAKGPS